MNWIYQPPQFVENQFLGILFQSQFSSDEDGDGDSLILYE